MPLPSSHKSSLAEKLYLLLLRTYPSDFREEHGREMLQTWRDLYCETLQQGATAKRMRFWSFILSDLISTACIEHWRSITGKFQHLAYGRKELIAMTTLLHLNVASHSDIGRVRASNEDRVISVVPQGDQLQAKGALFIVADGLGGHHTGDRASEMAVEQIRDAYYQSSESEDLALALQHAVEQANTGIYEANLADQKHTSEPSKDSFMGTTCVASVIRKEMLIVANVGDSRAYVIHEGQIRQLSLDHTPEQEEYRAGKITWEQAQAKKGNKITRCLGIDAEVAVDIQTEKVQDGDLVVLCTDGLTGLVSDDEIREIVLSHGPQESVTELIARANERGGTDNITALVVRVSSQETQN